MTDAELKTIIASHALWLAGDPAGKRADLADANLSGANLSGATLSGARLVRARLVRARLADANLAGADLSGANLSGATLVRARLVRARLADANLADADLPRFQICPSEGPFIAWKQVALDVVLKLQIIGDRTSSLVGRKCRCSSARVLEAIGAPEGATQFQSKRDKAFVYRLGEVAEATNYSSDIRVECAPGIHFFVTRAEAEEYCP